MFEFALSPDNDDNAAMFAPGLIVQTLQALRSALQDVLPELLQMLVAKVSTCDLEALRGSLLAVVARCAPGPMLCATIMAETIVKVSHFTFLAVCYRVTGHRVTGVYLGSFVPLVCHVRLRHGHSPAIFAPASSLSLSRRNSSIF